MQKADDKNFFVLFVQSDPGNLLLVKKSLEDNRRFPSVVDQASSISEALDKIKKNFYHVIVSDADLENEKGLKLLDEIARIRAQVPFVLMTPVRDDELVREAMKRGVADLIIKNEAEYQTLSEKLRKCYSRFHAAGLEKSVGDLFQPAAGVEEAPKPQFSIHDQLTGLYNHSYLHDRIVREFSRAQRYNYPISCVLIDIDHFHTVNEEKGYRVGEEILKQAAGLLFENCRLSDFIARYGGEEFALVLPHVGYEGAREAALRLNKIFAENVFKTSGGDVRVTVSIGVAAFPEDTMRDRVELISFANQALFRSKAAGRNLVTLYRDIVPVFGDRLPDLKMSEDRVVEFQRRMMEITHTARRAYLDVSRTLIRALETKDHFTAGHAASTAKYCLQVAELMGMSPEEAEVVQHAGLLHDIGKICIPDSILLKPSRLTIVEFETMKQHPYLGYKILNPIKFLQQESILVLHHHEWFNGEGYPCRLKGAEIPLGARIIAVIDTYDTIRSSGGRYKKTGTVEAAVNELINCAGAQFDPGVVKAFIEVLKTRGELTSADNYNRARLEQVIEETPVPPPAPSKAA